MKTFKFLLMGLLVAAAVVSCSKVPTENTELYIGGQSVSTFSSENNGGNYSCEELEALIAQKCPDFTEFEHCSNRFDYSGGSAGSEGYFGIIHWWTEDGIHLNWETTNGAAVNIALIIKGGPNSRIYFSGCGTCLKEGEGLTAPLNLNNSNNIPYGISNITICYSSCEEEEDLIIAVKLWYKETDGSTTYGVSSGSFAFPGSMYWCEILGYNSFPGSSFDIVKNYSTTPVANVTYSGDQVIVTALGGRILERTYVYIGTLEDLQTDNLDVPGGCPIYENWMANTVAGTTQSFTTH